MIAIANIKKIDLSAYSQIWGAVRGNVYLPKGVTLVPCLSHTNEEINVISQLRRMGKWDGPNFVQYYLPRILRLYRQPAAMDRISELARAGAMGTPDIAVVHTQPWDTQLSFACVLAGILQGMGIQVWTPTGEDYSAYFSLWANTESDDFA